MSKISERGELAGDLVGDIIGDMESATSRNDIIVEERIEIVVDIGEKSAVHDIIGGDRGE